MNDTMLHLWIVHKRQIAAGIAMLLPGVCPAVVGLSSMTEAVVLEAEASAWTTARSPAVNEPAGAVAGRANASAEMTTVQMLRKAAGTAADNEPGRRQRATPQEKEEMDIS